MEPVAVYGTLRKGQPNHFLLKNAAYIETIKIPKLKMHDFGAFPFCTNKDTTEQDTITAEIYHVDKQTLAALDRLEGHPSFYTRELVNCTNKNGERIAFIYLINKDNSIKNTNRILSGDWLQRE